MSHLRELQLAFGDYLVAPRVGLPIGNNIVSDEKGDAELRLALYGDSYVLRLIEAMGVDYPGVHALLGDENFDSMCRAYIDQYPSTHPSIRWFGRSLTSFLKATPPYCEHEVLLEMAEFEWAKVKCSTLKTALSLPSTSSLPSTLRTGPGCSLRLFPR